MGKLLSWTRLALPAGLLAATPLLLAAPAALAAPKLATPAATCSANEKQNGVEEESVTISRAVFGAPHPTVVKTYVELWYSPTCRYVWAEQGGAGYSGDEVWIYNEDTGTTKDAYYPTTATAAIDDAGTESHACFDSSAVNETEPKTCTGYF